MNAAHYTHQRTQLLPLRANYEMIEAECRRNGREWSSGSV